MNNFIEKDDLIFVCYDIKLRDYFTKNGIRWLLVGRNMNNNRDFCVYNKTDRRVVQILEKWKRKELVFD